MNTLHSYLAYYLLAINAVTFIVYGIDKSMHKKFKYGIPAILLIQIALMAYLHMN